MIKILWVSRHEPLREQVEELQQVFGDVEITRYCDIVYSGAQLVQVFDDGEYDEMVVVLPVELIRQLIIVGIQPLKPVLHREVIRFGEVRLRHHHFERIIYIDYVSEPLMGE